MNNYYQKYKYYKKIYKLQKKQSAGDDNFNCKGYKNKPCPKNCQQLKQTKGQQYFYNTKLPYTYCYPK